MNKKDIQILECKALLDLLDIYIIKYGESVFESKKQFGGNKGIASKVNRLLKK